MSRVLVVLALALVLRLGYLAVVHDGPADLLQPDSGLYLSLARDLIETGGFNRSTGAGVEPETERVPGYVLWLATFRVVAGDDPLWPVLGQAVLDALACVLIALLAGRLDARLRLPAGLLAALNLNMIAAAGVVLTDSLYLAVFTGWLLATVRYIDRPTGASALLAGALLGLATLARAMTQFFPPLLALVVFIAARRSGAGPGRAFGHALLALAACLLVLAPLGLRNGAQFGHLALSSQGGVHALYWVMPAALEFAEGVPFETGQQAMRARLEAAYPERSADPFVESRRAMAVARGAAVELGVLGLTHAWIAGTLINLAAPSLVAVPPVQRLERPSFYATPGAGAFDKALNYLRATDNVAVLAVLGGAGVVTVVIRLVQLVGLVTLGRALVRPSWLFLLAVALYVVVVTGPVTGVKYRLPLEPLLTILLAAGLARPWRGRRPAESGTSPATTPPTARS